MLLENQGVADGVYRVLQIRTEGDTRGNPWFMDLTCIGATTGTLNNQQQDYFDPGLGLS